eukprot:scaffold239171_cov33-Tisochrysis_lutea.AAC.1
MSEHRTHRTFERRTSARPSTPTPEYHSTTRAPRGTASTTVRITPSNPSRLGWRNVYGKSAMGDPDLISSTKSLSPHMSFHAPSSCEKMMLFGIVLTLTQIECHSSELLPAGHSCSTSSFSTASSVAVRAFATRVSCTRPVQRWTPICRYRSSPEVLMSSYARRSPVDGRVLHNAAGDGYHTVRSSFEQPYDDLIRAWVSPHCEFCGGPVAMRRAPPRVQLGPTLIEEAPRLLEQQRGLEPL